MSSVYTRRLLLSHAGAGVTYTVPPGFVATVTWIVAFNANAVLPETFHLVHSGSAVTVWQGDVLPSSSVAVNMRWVLEAGDELVLTSGGDMDVAVAGYEFSLP
jgi:hypothetical protein